MTLRWYHGNWLWCRGYSVGVVTSFFRWYTGTHCYTHTKPLLSIPDLVYGTNNYRKLGNTYIFWKAIVNHQNMGGCCFTNCPPEPYFLQMFPPTKLLPGQDQQAATRLRCRFAAWWPRGQGPSEGSYQSQVR